MAEFCEQLLAPTLHPGDLVILNNLSSHKSSAAIAAVERVGAETIYLPPYSPDLNPIENIFSIIKHWIRGFRPRGWDEIIEAVHNALLEINLDDLDNALTYCGYATA